MSQTPVEFLAEQLQSAGFIPKDSPAVNYIIEAAKRKEAYDKAQQENKDPTLKWFFAFQGYRNNRKYLANQFNQN